jgi:hypothetical protein
MHISQYAGTSLNSTGPPVRTAPQTNELKFDI